jgi:predicted CXXCH cytochrome family protein
MLLIAAGGLWLFLAAVPVLADGGPHVAAINNGTSGISADSCAGCHRAHRAQGEYLLLADSGTALCLSCHGATGLGSAVDVESGVQYTLGTTDVRGSNVLGYLRGGGFVDARIGSGEAARIAYMRTATDVSQLAKVPVRTAGSQPVTSAHLPNVGGVVGAADGVAWGNGPNSTTAYAGPAVELECGTCHNPHGNGQYRILNPMPDPAATTPDVFVPAAVGVTVTDAALPPAGDTRNYTIIQTPGGTGTLRASQVETLKVTYSLPDTAGDYFRRRVPWNTSTGTFNDAPNGQSATFTTQISTWCTTCHSRYLSQGWATKEDDAIFTYRHTATNTSRNCITCHVSHGSNAQMTGTYSANMEYPGGAVAPVGDSRLLKADNRGTCQLCHDPTGTITAGTWVGPTPNPILP